MIEWIIVIGIAVVCIGLGLVVYYYDTIPHLERGCVSVKTGNQYMMGYPPMWYDEYEWVCPK